MMKVKDVLNLRNGDEVVVKKTKKIPPVEDVVTIPKGVTTNRTVCAGIRLADGNWYGCKELSISRKRRTKV